jgi:hypothetical protein
MKPGIASHATRVLGRIGLKASFLFTGLWLCSCGCSYETASAVQTNPPRDCLTAQADTSCTVGDLHVTNHCLEDLLVTPVGSAAPVTIRAGSSGTLHINRYAEVAENDKSCQALFTIRATLGSVPVTLEFSAKMTNRGLFGC